MNNSIGKMKAWTIRKERYGTPLKAMKLEEVDVPEPGDGEVIVKNKAAGVNYNGIWASKGKPKDVVNVQKQYGNDVDFIIPGSESAGIIVKIGRGVTEFAIGDEVICYPAQYDAKENIADPRLSNTFRVWGYENNWGAFAEYSKLMKSQCFHKPKELSWEEAACTVAAGATVYSMLTHFKENKLKKGDTVLIWGGSGGVGLSAIILTRLLGGIPVAVVSDDEKTRICMNYGAAGCINRKEYTHWGATVPDMYKDENKYNAWLKEALRMKIDIRKIPEVTGDPKIVIEHPGESTMPTSLFLCAKGGMVVTCGATSGYDGTFDIRHLWMHLKRIQGSHVCCREEVREYLKIMKKSNIKIPVGKIYNFFEAAQAHQDLFDGRLKNGRLVVRIS